MHRDTDTYEHTDSKAMYTLTHRYIQAQIPAQIYGSVVSRKTKAVGCVYV